MKIKAFRHCASGDEFSISYGALGNSELLQHYGFALPSNPYDTIDVEMQLEGGNEGDVKTITTRLYTDKCVPIEVISAIAEHCDGDGDSRLSISR